MRLSQSTVSFTCRSSCGNDGWARWSMRAPTVRHRLPASLPMCHPLPNPPTPLSSPPPFYPPISELRNGGTEGGRNGGGQGGGGSSNCTTKASPADAIRPVALLPGRFGDARADGHLPGEDVQPAVEKSRNPDLLTSRREICVPCPTRYQRALDGGDRLLYAWPAALRDNPYLTFPRERKIP